jgi:hypothetical protein
MTQTNTMKTINGLELIILGMTYYVISEVANSIGDRFCKITHPRETEKK